MAQSWTEVNEINTSSKTEGGSIGTTNCRNYVRVSHAFKLSNIYVLHTMVHSWTEIAELNTGENTGVRAGSNISNIFGGYRDPTNNNIKVEEWDGSIMD